MLLHLPLILETRRNHALEHATLHVLARSHPGPLAGHSNPGGYLILGQVSTEALSAAANEALQRLKAGESHLAIHPGCGTNLVAYLALIPTLAWLPMRGRKSTLMRLVLLPLAITFALLGFWLARSLGPRLQEHITTEPDLGDLQIVAIQRLNPTLHLVITRSHADPVPVRHG